MDKLEKNIIKFEKCNIHFILDNTDNILFNAKDTALALGYEYPKDAIIKFVKDKNKIKLEDINTDEKIKKHPHSIYITESGLYSLMLSSKMKKAEKFRDWITTEVLPAIRRYGYYKIKDKINSLMEKINKLEKEKKTIEKDLKKDKYPDGGMVYVLDYSEDDNEIYRIGRTADMKDRKSVYDTHTLHKRDVSHYKDTKCPIRLETCVRALLYDYRYQDKRDYYVCNLKIIRKAFDKCVESIECMDQKGGGNVIDDLFGIDKLRKNKTKLEKRIKKIKVVLDESSDSE